MKDIINELKEKMKSQCEICRKWFYVKNMTVLPIQLYPDCLNFWRVEYYCKKCYKRKKK